MAFFICAQQFRLKKMHTKIGIFYTKVSYSRSDDNIDFFHLLACGGNLDFQVRFLISITVRWGSGGAATIQKGGPRGAKPPWPRTNLLMDNTPY